MCVCVGWGNAGGGGAGGGGVDTMRVWRLPHCSIARGGRNAEPVLPAAGRRGGGPGVKYDPEKFTMFVCG